MAIATNKQKIFNQLLTSLAKIHKEEEAGARPVLEQFLYALCREGSTRAAADRAFQNLQQRFFDWNELRVSSTEEIAESLEGLGGELEPRAQRIIDFLQEVFETTFSFDLESLHKKGTKLAAKQLTRYKASSDYIGAWVVQQSLGGHAIPLDGPSLRVLKRLHLVDDASDNFETIRTSLEHHVPKTKGSLFIDGLSEIAESVCWETDPQCPECPLKSFCPTGQERLAATVNTTKKPR